MHRCFLEAKDFVEVCLEPARIRHVLEVTPLRPDPTETVVEGVGDDDCVEAIDDKPDRVVEFRGCSGPIHEPYGT